VPCGLGRGWLETVPARLRDRASIVVVFMFLRKEAAIFGSVGIVCCWGYGRCCVGGLGRYVGGWGVRMRMRMEMVEMRCELYVMSVYYPRRSLERA
jgi:hypothetical protein